MTPAPATIPDPANPTMDCQILETEKTHVTREEHALLKELLRPGASIDAVIPEDATPDELWKTLEACAHGIAALEARLCRVKPIVGKILLLFEKKPSLYKELGYETYSDFMSKGVYEKLGLHRTSAYEGKLVARDWPQLSPDRYVKIGPKRLNILSKFTTGSNSNAEQWLEVAEKMKVPEFKTYVEQRGFIAPGEATGATIAIQTNLAVYKLWKQFVSDGRVQSVVGSKDPGRILEALLQECFDEWISRHEEERRRKFEEAHAVT